LTWRDAERDLLRRSAGSAPAGKEGEQAMPIMNVRYPAGRLEEAEKAALAKELTDVLIRMEGGANTEGGRAFAWVCFSEVAEGDWWVGGRTDDRHVFPPGRFLVHVTIPEGYMNAARKGEVHAWVSQAIIEVAGDHDSAAHPKAGASILVVIDEVPEGNWGAAGRTISLESIADTVGMPKDGSRFAWVRSYFAAKARMLAAAGYPSDMGGVPSSDAPVPDPRSARQA
jgi:phenylpyruvate tautomerase PptA (4-oxalocrotonate tautomerase family)